MRPTKANGANLGFENKLWEMADKLRGHMGVADDKHVVLGVVFAKYIPESFREKYPGLKTRQETEYTHPKDGGDSLVAHLCRVLRGGHGCCAWAWLGADHLALRGSKGFLGAKGSLLANQPAQGRLGRFSSCGDCRAVTSHRQRTTGGLP